MKNIFIVALLIALGANLNAQTTVNSNIYTNTTWTKANSPYLVTIDTVVVFSSATLTIEPGVTVLFCSNTRLEVRGGLYTNGTSTDSITFAFSGTNTKGNSSKVPWFGIDIENNTNDFNLKYCVFSEAQAAIYSSSQLGYNDSISHCTFKNNIQGVAPFWSYVVVDNCTFTNNTTAINTFATVQNSYFSSNHTAIITAVNILNNYIKGNGIGIYFSINGFQVSGNTIIDNDTGVFVSGTNNPPQITSNSICNNRYYNVVMSKATDLYAHNNCWCSSDSLAIRATMYDGYTNSNEGLVHFVPFNTCSAPDTSSITTITAAPTQPSSFVTIAPNPNSGNFNVQLQNSMSSYAYTVYDNKGTTISNGSIGGSGAIRLSNAMAGIYYLVVFSDQQKYTEKIVVE